MDFLDAVQKLATANPDVTYSEVRAAMQNEVDAEVKDSGRPAGRVYEQAVTTAYERIGVWLATGADYSVVLTWRDVAKFAASHRTACVWAVCVANAREAAKQEKEQQEEQQEQEQQEQKQQEQEVSS